MSIKEQVIKYLDIFYELSSRDKEIIEAVCNTWEVVPKSKMTEKENFEKAIVENVKRLEELDKIIKLAENAS